MKNPLSGYRFIITAGGTSEPIDPVRSITNRSSGKMGIAVLKACLGKKLPCVLVHTGTTVSLPVGRYRKILAPTAAAMEKAVKKEFRRNRVLVMTAAVSDFTVRRPARNKIKRRKSGLKLELVPTRDILAGLKRPAGSLIVAFSAETKDLHRNSAKKLKSKNADMIIANDVSRKDTGFASDHNRITILYPGGKRERFPKKTKKELGRIIVDRIGELIKSHMSTVTRHA